MRLYQKYIRRIFIIGTGALLIVAAFSYDATLARSNSRLMAAISNLLGVDTSASYRIWGKDGPNGVAFAAASGKGGMIYVAGFESIDNESRSLVVAYDAQGEEVWRQSDNPTPGDDTWAAIAYDPDGFLYVAGYGAGGSYGRVKKIDVATRADVWTYSNKSDFTSANQTPTGLESIVVGGNGIIYVGGYDNMGVTTKKEAKKQWRIEKLNTLVAPERSRVWLVQRNPTGVVNKQACEGEVVWGATGNAEQIYAVGFEAVDEFDGAWRMEALTGSGTTEWSAVSDPVPFNYGSDCAWSVDQDAEYIYVAGHDGGQLPLGAGGRMRLEKRKKSDGTLVARLANFDNAGTNVAAVARLDEQRNVYLAGHDVASGARLRVLKIGNTIVNGEHKLSLLWKYTHDPTAYQDEFLGGTFDAETKSFYAVGYTDGGHSGVKPKWRIERISDVTRSTQAKSVPQPEESIQESKIVVTPSAPIDTRSVLKILDQNGKEASRVGGIYELKRGDYYGFEIALGGVEPNARVDKFTVNVKNESDGRTSQLSGGEQTTLQNSRLVITPLRMTLAPDSYTVMAEISDAHGERIVDGTRLRVSTGAPPTPKVNIQNFELRDGAGKMSEAIVQGREAGLRIYAAVQTTANETLYSMKLVSKDNAGKRLLIDLGTFEGSGMLEKQVNLPSTVNLSAGSYYLIMETAVMDTIGNIVAEASRRSNVTIKEK